MVYSRNKKKTKKKCLGIIWENDKNLIEIFFVHLTVIVTLINRYIFIYKIFFAKCFMLSLSHV